MVWNTIYLACLTPNWRDGQYDADNKIRTDSNSSCNALWYLFLYMGDIMEKINYTPVWWKIHREHKMSPYAVYEPEWYFDYDTNYPKDRLSWKSIYLMKDEYDRIGGVYYRMCR